MQAAELGNPLFYYTSMRLAGYVFEYITVFGDIWMGGLLAHEYEFEVNCD